MEKVVITRQIYLSHTVYYVKIIGIIEKNKAGIPKIFYNHLDKINNGEISNVTFSCHFSISFIPESRMFISPNDQFKKKSSKAPDVEFSHLKQYQIKQKKSKTKLFTTDQDASFMHGQCS